MKHRIKGYLAKKLVELKRRSHHPLIHHIHKKHKISYKTLFYMKEYGPRSHVSHVIIRESLRILIIASLISSLGGFGLQTISSKLILILPLLILVPALNNLIGSFGTIFSSKFTTMLYLGKIKEKWWKSREVHKLFFTILSIAILSSFIIGVFAYTIAVLKGFELNFILFAKIIQISFLSTISLFFVIFFISITGGLYIYKKNEDPNNFLIPMTTSIGDLSSMLIFFVLVNILF